MAVVVYYCGPAKTTHDSFCLAILEKLMKDFLGRLYLVMNINPIISVGRQWLEIRYE